MKNFSKVWISFLLYGSLCTMQANAQGRLSYWDFEAPPSAAPTSVSAGIIGVNATAAGVTNVTVTSPGTNGSSAQNAFNALSATGWPTRPMSGTASLDPGKYYEFSITAEPGCTFTPSSFQINYRSLGVSGANPGYHQVRSSFDGFTTSLNTLQSNGLFNSVTPIRNGGYMAATFSSSGNTTPPSPFGVPAQTSLSFRVYFYNNPDSTRKSDIDRVAISGRVACPMPVEFVSFEGKAVGTKVQLNWATSLERNADRFEVERSQNATEFGSIGQVRATGESTQKQAYGFTDEQAQSGVNYYRLRQVDRDGSVQFSRIIAVTMRPEAPAIRVLGNPTEASRIKLQLFNLDASQLRLTDMQGRSVGFRVLESAAGVVTLEATGSFTSGTYLVGAAKVPAIKVVVR